VDNVFGDSPSKGARRGPLLTALVFAAAPALAGSHLAFTRVVSTAYSLPAGQRIAFVYAVGDNPAIEAFVEDFVDFIERADTLRIVNAVENNKYAGSLDKMNFRKLHKEHPADKYLGVTAFTCSGIQKSGKGSERDELGERVQRVHEWLDATCEARVDVRDDRGQHVMSMNVHGEGTSPRSTSLTEEEKQVAFDQAARYAALNAADMITPRVVRETIELDESAPSFEEGMSMIDANRLQDARAMWEAALRHNGNSAALNFNLAALCEATGDSASARKYFQAAVHLAPNESRYRVEMRRAGSRRP
jgi:tetratricopeptide (TPR) repeat protein